MKKLVLFTATILLLSTSCKKEKQPEELKPITTKGSYYAGGVVFYLDGSGQHGLVMSDSDVGEYKWRESNVGAVGTTSYYIGEGKSNTEEIVQFQGSGSYAAKACNDLVLNGYSDWYLPSQGELKEAVKYESAIGLGGARYWSSTEYYPDYDHTGYNAWFFQVSNPTSFETDESKSLIRKVRAVRSF